MTTAHVQDHERAFSEADTPGRPVITAEPVEDLRERFSGEAARQAAYLFLEEAETAIAPGESLPGGDALHRHLAARLSATALAATLTWLAANDNAVFPETDPKDRDGGEREAPAHPDPVDVVRDTAPARPARRAARSIGRWRGRLGAYVHRFDHAALSWNDHAGRSESSYGVRSVLEDICDRLAAIEDVGPVGSPFELFVNDAAAMVGMVADLLNRASADPTTEPDIAAELEAMADDLDAMRQEWWAAISAKGGAA